MIYFHCAMTGKDDWSVIGRAYATALWGTGLPARVAWPERVALIPDERWPELGAKASDHPVVQLGATVPERASVLIRAGEPKTILAAEERAPVNIALVWFRGVQPKPRIVKRLKKRFDEVWCLTEEDASWVEGYHIPFPSQGHPKKGSSRLLWGHWSEIENAARDALKSGSRLVIVSEECPFRFAEDAKEWYGGDIPCPLTIRRTPKTDAERAALLRACGHHIRVKREQKILADVEAYEGCSFARTSIFLKKRLIEQRDITFVIPHKNRGAEEVQATLDTLLPQMGKQDDVLVSDQGTEGFGVLGVRIIRDPNPPDVWNISRARNLGLAEVKTKHVMFLDCDINLPDGFVSKAREWLAAHPYEGLSPMVEGRGPGSGISILPVEEVREAGGFDESFEGYGSEDIDLFMHLREKGIEVRAKGPSVIHRDHPPSPHRETYGRKNMQKLAERWGI
jgi:hypothetical protein